MSKPTTTGEPTLSPHAEPIGAAAPDSRHLTAPSRASRPGRPPRSLLARLRAVACDCSRPDLALAIAYLETAEQPRDHGSTSYGWAIEELAAVMGEQLVWLLEDPDPSDERTDRAARVRELAELVALAARGLESAARAERADTA